MSDLQQQLNQILSDPDALRQVQSLGQKLGLNAPPPAAPVETKEQSGELAQVVSRLAPLMSRTADDDTAALLNALRPFLSGERARRLDQAQRMLKLIRMIPLIKDSGLF